MTTQRPALKAAKKAARKAGRSLDRLNELIAAQPHKENRIIAAATVDLIDGKVFTFQQWEVLSGFGSSVAVKS